MRRPFARNIGMTWASTRQAYREPQEGSLEWAQIERERARYLIMSNGRLPTAEENVEHDAAIARIRGHVRRASIAARAELGTAGAGSTAERCREEAANRGRRPSSGAVATEPLSIGARSPSLLCPLLLSPGLAECENGSKGRRA